MFFSDDEIEEMLNNIFNNDDDIDPISLSEEEDLDYVKKNIARSLSTKCECGADSCKLPFHSDYCPKYKKI